MLGAWILAGPAAPAVAERAARVPVLGKVLVSSEVQVLAQVQVPVDPPVQAEDSAAGAGADTWPPVVLEPAMAAQYNVARTNVRAGTEIKVTTERKSMALRLSEMNSGSWVILELPGFTAAASGTPQASLDALRKASDTSYYKAKDSLWVKVVSNGDSSSGGPGGGTNVQVSREVARRCKNRSPPAAIPKWAIHHPW